MIELLIPGWKRLTLKHMVCDMNGTLTVDGAIQSSTVSRLEALSQLLSLHVITSDTFNQARMVFEGLPVEVTRIQGEASVQKRKRVEQLGAEVTVACGNGRNDVQMLKCAALSLAVLGEEGACVEALNACHLVFTHPDHLLDSLLQPKRLVAGLRG